MENDFDILKDSSLFEGFRSQDISEMLPCLAAKLKAYKKETYIKQEGESADFIGIVLEGTIQILQDDYNGNRNITSAFGPGQLFAEAFACAAIPTLPVSILAATDCSILFLDAQKLLQPCTKHCGFHNQLIQNLLKIVSGKILLLSKKLSYMSHKTTDEKLIAYLCDQAKEHHSLAFTIPYNRQALADYLGVERSALSAEIGKLKRQGVLETNRSFFKLLCCFDSRTI